MKLEYANTLKVFHDNFKECPRFLLPLNIVPCHSYSAIFIFIGIACTPLNSFNCFEWKPLNLINFNELNDG